MRIVTVSDQVDVRALGIEEALLHRLNPAAPLTERGLRYRGLSLVQIGRDYLSLRGVHQTESLDSFEIANHLMHSRSGGAMGATDFPSIVANVARKVLRRSYLEAPVTYTKWARRAPNVPDFKPVLVGQISAAPDLLQLDENGEFKHGVFSDSGVTYKAATYGRIATLSREAIVNDDLKAFGRIIEGFGIAARRLENHIVYQQILDDDVRSEEHTSELQSRVDIRMPSSA